MQEPDVDEAGPEGAKAVLERGAGRVGGEGRLLSGRGDRIRGTCYAALERRNTLEHGADDAACGTQHATAFWRSDAIFRCDGDVVVTGAELAEAALGFAIAVHGRNVEVADARVIGGFEQAKALTVTERADDGRTAVAEPSCLAAAGCEPGFFHDASAYGLGYRSFRCSSLTGEEICKAHCECEYGVGGIGEA